MVRWLKLAVVSVLAALYGDVALRTAGVALGVTRDEFRVRDGADREFWASEQEFGAHYEQWRVLERRTVLDTGRGAG